jgi:hypothetical protein
VHETAFLATQLTVEVPPNGILVGLATISAVGIGGAGGCAADVSTVKEVRRLTKAFAGTPGAA